VSKWEVGDDGPQRHFVGREWDYLTVGGLQRADGTIETRWVIFREDDRDAVEGAAQARVVGREWLAAADELTRLAALSYRDACKAGVAVVDADAERSEL
jgi:hypothetical protein